jgi:hypothetical protein
MVQYSRGQAFPDYYIIDWYYSYDYKVSGLWYFLEYFFRMHFVGCGQNCILLCSSQIKLHWANVVNSTFIVRVCETIACLEFYTDKEFISGLRFCLYPLTIPTLWHVFSVGLFTDLSG